MRLARLGLPECPSGADPWCLVTQGLLPNQLFERRASLPNPGAPQWAMEG
jgi:hypothetical protein